MYTMSRKKYRVDSMTGHADFNTMAEVNRYAAMQMRGHYGIDYHQCLSKYNSTSGEYERVKSWRYSK